MIIIIVIVLVLSLILMLILMLILILIFNMKVGRTAEVEHPVLHGAPLHGPVGAVQLGEGLRSRIYTGGFQEYC